MASSQTHTSLPLREVTLYNNGYAVFQRRGDVVSSGSIDLYFPREDMPRVLKSLHLNDSNRVIGNVSYTSSQTSTEIHLDKDEPLKSLFSNTHGVKCRIILVAGEDYTGVVLGLQCTPVERAADVCQLTLLLDNDAVRVFDLAQVKEFTFLDSEVICDLHHSIENEKNAKKKNMQKNHYFLPGRAAGRAAAPTDRAVRHSV